MTMYPCYLPGLLGQPSRCLFVLEQRDNCFAMESGVFTLLLTDSVVKRRKVHNMKSIRLLRGAVM